jgi:hypothetical protein
MAHPNQPFQTKTSQPLPEAGAAFFPGQQHHGHLSNPDFSV